MDKMHWECRCKRKCICRDRYTAGFRREICSSSCYFFRRLTFFSRFSLLWVATWMETNHCTWPQSKIESGKFFSSGPLKLLLRGIPVSVQMLLWSFMPTPGSRMLQKVGWRYVKNVETLLKQSRKFRNGYNNTNLACYVQELCTCRSRSFIWTFFPQGLMCK